MVEQTDAEFLAALKVSADILHLIKMVEERGRERDKVRAELRVAFAAEKTANARSDMNARSRLIAEAERDEALREVERLRAALREIRNQDQIDAALDPEWASRIANAALAASPQPTK